MEIAVAVCGADAESVICTERVNIVPVITVAHDDELKFSNAAVVAGRVSKQYVGATGLSACKSAKNKKCFPSYCVPHFA
ncbi:MAG: hypothetical protein UX35_C0001G0013 [Microgenomates group bacterium GW2011_GWA1_46_15]|nr:MAG: hypothetical protein UX35_C0001G0013 [Microgenomates group bacterium GW2011_GWA1_46_15]